MKLTVLSITCSIMQIVGLVMFALAKQLPAFTPVLIGIAGFAAIVRFFIPDGVGIDKTLRPYAAVAGFVIIILACIMK